MTAEVHLSWCKKYYDFEDLPAWLTTPRSALDSKELTKWLLEHGADPNLPGKRGITPLAKAAWTSSIEILELLLKHGARLEGSRALSAAASRNGPNQIKKVSFLLQAGADINEVDFEPPWLVSPVLKIIKSKGTALHSASKFGDKPEMIDFLLKHGGDPKIKNSDGLTPAAFKEWVRKVSDIDPGHCPSLRDIANI